MNSKTKTKIIAMAVLLTLSQWSKITPYLPAITGQNPQADTKAILSDCCRYMSVALRSNEKINTSNRLHLAWWDAWQFVASQTTGAATGESAEAHQSIWKEVETALGVGETSIDLDQSQRDQAAAIFDKHWQSSKK